MSERIAIIDLTGAHRPRPGAGPLAAVCGLPLLTRNLVLLQDAGYAAALLLAAPEDRDAVAPALRAHPRLALPIDWLDPGSAPLARAVRLRPTARALLWWPGGLTFGRHLPALASGPVPPAGGVLGLGPEGDDLGLLLLDAGAAAEAGDPAAARARIAGSGALRRAPADAPTPPVVVRSEADRRRAEELLVVSLRKEADGFVARYTRHISLAISRRLMRWPISPNAVTLAAAVLVVGLASLAAHGGYGWMLAAALGFELQNILDGIDGEIARAKLLSSVKGEWLDTLCDDTANAVFMGALSLGGYRATGWEGYLVLGVLAVAGQVLSSALMYHNIWTVHRSGNLNHFKMPWEEDAPAAGAPAHPLVQRVVRAQFLFRRDTFGAVALLLALVGQLQLMAWFFAVGGTAVWVSIVGYRLARWARLVGRRPRSVGR